MKKCFLSVVMIVLVFAGSLMALNEIQKDYEAGHTLYAIISNDAGQVVVRTDGTFEDWGATSHTIADYAIEVNHIGDANSIKYRGHFDANATIPAGRYSGTTCVQAGASPTNGDAIIQSWIIYWGNSEKILFPDANGVVKANTVEIEGNTPLNADELADTFMAKAYKDPNNKLATDANGSVDTVTLKGQEPSVVIRQNAQSIRGSP